MKWTITPEQGSLDEVISIQLSDLTPKRKITLRASMLDDQQQSWSSSAVFKTDAEGKIDLHQQAPLSGSYQGVDDEGLFWSMKPAKNAAPHSLFSVAKLNAITIKLAAYEKRRLIGECEITRHIRSPQTERIDVNESDVSGILFLPGSNKNYPGVVMIPGVGGVASIEGTAALLAAKGYVVFVLAYCRYKNLPDELYELPLERFRDGIQWLKRHEQVDANRVTVMGIAKGAEALLASLCYLPDQGVKGVILQSPSHVVWQGMGKRRPEKKSSWTLFQEPLFYLSFTTPLLWMEMMKCHWYQKLKLDRWFSKGCVGVRSVSAYKRALRNKHDEEEAMIPAERMKSKILLISGQDDQVWPSSLMGKRIAAHLQQHHFAYPVIHLDFANVGHLVRYPGVPTTVQQVASAKFVFSLGGRAKEHAKANRQYWEQLLHFLK